MNQPLPFENNQAPPSPGGLEVAAMPKHCDLQIYIHDEEAFLLDKKFLTKYCGRMKQILNQEKRGCHNKNLSIEINDFPGGPEGFELVSRFCYNNGKISITVSNVLILYCCALYLGMTEDVFSNNLLQQTQTFLEGICYWTWNETLMSLKSCELFYTYADSYGLLEKIIFALQAKMAQNFDVNPFTSSSPSSPEINSAKRLSYSTHVTTPKTIKSTLPSKAWWFEDLATLPPKIIEKFLVTIGAYKTDNNNLIVTRFLLHYLKKVTPARDVNCKSSSNYAGLAETAAYGVKFVGNNTFSFKGLFRVLRIFSRFGMSRDCRIEIEKLIGGVLEEATLDDLLVSGHHMGLYYDVTFVIRLIKQFVDMNGSDYDVVSLQKLKKVGRLIDKYLAEISPDQNLKISKFLAVAECLPDYARDCFDGVYRAIDIYLQAHPMLTFVESSRLCGCLNYSKLSFEACKDLAKNHIIPPRIAMQALISQQKKIPQSDLAIDESEIMNPSQIILYYDKTHSFLEEKEDRRLHLEKMQRRVRELENLCREMKVQISRFH
ncbi:hypothetical protein VNO77_42070 [Canavalia gladiata]|uniref:NPH3 domain-containing protein n=1 Tax=Canavalia gladiata TaxID=3824 RepID=A0AAN9PSE2_CANGL